MGGDTFTQTQMITASSPAASDNFGVGVGISGDHAIVGAYYQDSAGSNAGAAYIFKRSGDTFTQTQMITASSPAASDNFGIGVGISDGHAIVGAYYQDSAGSN